jgi:hypothetical protein
MDEQVFAPAVGLMLLDMLLGPPATFDVTEPDLITSIKGSLGGLFKKVKL